MSNPRILLIGAGGHGKAVAWLLREAGWPPPLGVLDDAPGGAGLPGIPWLGPVAAAGGLRAGGAEAAHVALGDNAARRRLSLALLALGFALPPLCHPAALLADDVARPEGLLAMPRVVVGPAARLGRFALLNTASIAEHDTVVGEAAHLAPGAIMGGGARLGEEALLGLGALLRPGVKVGARAVVGVGAAVVADLAEGARVGGVPARPL